MQEEIHSKAEHRMPVNHKHMTITRHFTEIFISMQYIYRIVFQLMQTEIDCTKNTLIYLENKVF